MTPAPDDVRALARSSPWLWRTLHLRTRGPAWGDVEAWLARPGRMAVRTEGRLIRQDHELGGGTAALAWSGGEPATPRIRHTWIGDESPDRRHDGLVLTRPESRFDDSGFADGEHVFVDADDPMWHNYSWVAMLDPVELSHHIALTDVEATTLRGRPSWMATFAAREGYEPRCSCCPLLWSAISDELEGQPLQPVYPSGYRIGLDRATGIATTLRALDGDRDDLAFDVEILEVDGDVQPALDAAARPRARGAKPARGESAGPGWTDFRA